VVQTVLASSGRALDAPIRALMERGFGRDFSDVRVHVDARAAESARAMRALAYTVGRDVVFGSGQFAPGTAAGDRLLAHELTHVIQQSDHRAERLQRQVSPASSRLQSPRFSPSAKLERCFEDTDRLGQRDPDTDAVTRIQQALIDVQQITGHTYDLGSTGRNRDGVDGDYGPKTAAAVKKFKADENLGFTQFGDVGPGTMHRLDELFSPEKEDKPKEDKPKEDKPKEDKPKEDKPKEDKPKEDKPPILPGSCGPGTENPFCLPPILPPESACCRPFADPRRALSEWKLLSSSLPTTMQVASLCEEVGPVWDAYFDAKSKPFAFSDVAGSCIAESAKRVAGLRGSGAAKDHAEAIDSAFALIMAFLPSTLMAVKPLQFPLGGSIATLRPSLVDAVGPDGEPGLHVDIAYGNPPQNAAGQVAGGTGRDGNGSDIFGDDDRVMGGPIVIDVTAIDPLTGAMSGEIRWQPHVHVKDTVDFCPGNLGGKLAQMVTHPMSKLEAGGLTRDVPITIDYSLELEARKFSDVRALPVRPPVPPPRRKRPPGPDEHPCK
jgi:hypothetical protein